MGAKCECFRGAEFQLGWRLEIDSDGDPVSTLRASEVNAVNGAHGFHMAYAYLYIYL